MTKPNAISIYVHIPWCQKKCPYCDFNSHLQNELFDEARYVRAIIDDIKRQDIAATELTSIFFGGGTPSLFAAKSFAQILDAIHDRIAITDATEITLEANPGSAEREKFAKYRDAGINRLSIGVQSLNNSQLKRIGRIHNADDARKALEMAADAGFSRLNADLMYALPNQTIDDVEIEVEELLRYPIDHLSAYQLTIEPNTYFYKRPPVLPIDETAIAMQNRIIELLSANHFKRYEVSAYALSGRESKHNLNYWNFGDYLAFGAGAHAKITTKHGIKRSRRHQSPVKYMDGLKRHDYIAESSEICADELFIEYCMNALRLVTGFSIANCINQTGINGSRLYAILQPLVDKGLINFGQTQIKTTDLGYRLLDGVLTEIMYNTEKIKASNYEKT